MLTGKGLSGLKLACLLGLSFWLTSCALLQDLGSLRLMTSPHLMLGNPSDARTRLGQPNNYLILKPQFAVSYNRDRGIPNWASWQLNASWLGPIERQNNFRADPSLPEDWPQITSQDYRDRRYDRGHLVPSGDRTASVADNAATFVFTNIVPQVPGNNRGPWSELEQYCRQLVGQGQELYIIAGSLGQQGRIGSAKVTVPSSVWKVIVVMPEPGLSAADVTAATRVIAVNIPNTPSVGSQSWRRFVTTVDEIEDLTGYELLSNVNQGVQRVIEGQKDLRSLQSMRLDGDGGGRSRLN